MDFFTGAGHPYYSDDFSRKPLPNFLYSDSHGNIRFKRDQLKTPVKTTSPVFMKRSQSLSTTVAKESLPPVAQILRQRRKSLLGALQTKINQTKSGDFVLPDTQGQA